MVSLTKLLFSVSYTSRETPYEPTTSMPIAMTETIVNATNASVISGAADESEAAHQSANSMSTMSCAKNLGEMCCWPSAPPGWRNAHTKPKKMVENATTIGMTHTTNATRHVSYVSSTSSTTVHTPVVALQKVSSKSQTISFSSTLHADLDARSS